MRGKEIKLNISDKYSVSIGTVDEKNPKSVYIMISTWLTPKSDSEIDYSRVIFNMNKHLKSYVSNILNQDFFNPELTIIDLDMRQSGIKYGKRSYVSLEVTLYQKDNPLDITSELLESAILDIIINVLGDTFESNLYFDFNKSKKCVSTITDVKLNTIKENRKIAMERWMLYGEPYSRDKETYLFKIPSNLEPLYPEITGEVALKLSEVEIWEDQRQRFIKHWDLIH